MGLMSETDRRFINLEKKLGIFILVALAGIGLLVFFIGMKNEIFTPKVIFYTIADSGKGLYEGMEVKLSGFRIGKVKKMYLDDITKIKLEMSINRDYVKWIKIDSRAILAKEGLIGEGIIEITPGMQYSLPLDPEGTIPFGREVGLNEIAEDLKGDINQLLTEIGEIIHYINNPEGDIKVMMANLNKLSSNLLLVSKNTERMINRTDKRLDSIAVNFNSMLNAATDAVNEAKKRIENLDSVIASADNSMGSIDSALPELIEKLNHSLENVEKITNDLGKVAQSKSADLGQVITKGERVMDQADEVLDSLKNTWPISNNVEIPENKSIRTDSHE